ncbi:DUF6612 family protein [Pseudogracilibacillus sp. ICA-222130]|uniref:DUF6612 family protein n=1 Tax=Pseudogracilibacillus sp. ICA-222130 TaxID=3134655 RepID=UPI0030C28C80
MKKGLKINLVLLAVAFVLFACSNKSNEQNADTNTNIEITNEQKETKKEKSSKNASITIDQLMEEVADVNKALDSFTMIEETNTIETFQEEESHLYTKEALDIVFEPFQMEVMMEQKQPKGFNEEEQESFEYEGGFYIVDGKTYMKLDGDTWSESENTLSDEEFREQEMMVFDHITETYRNVAEKESLDETEDTYVVTFELQPQQATKMDKNAEQPAFEALNNTYKVEEMTVQITIAKETLFVTEIVLDKTFTYDEDFNIEKDKMTVHQKQVQTFSNQNAIEAVTVPDDIKQNAEPM